MTEQSGQLVPTQAVPEPVGSWVSRRVRRTLLGDPVFARFWLSRFCSQTAQGAILYALLILIADKTDRSIYTSLFVICAILPAVLFGLPAGISVDSLPRIPLLVSLNFLRVAFVLALVNAHLSMMGIFAVALGLWTIHQFYAPAESALMASLIERPQLAQAQSLSNLALSLAQLAGLVFVAPVFLRFANPSTLFAFCGVLWIAAAVLVGLLAGHTHEAVQNLRPKAGLRQSLGNGWRFVRRDHAIYEVFVADMLVGIGGSALIVLIPLYLKGVLDTNAENTVFVFAPAALGLMLGLRIAPALNRIIGGRRTATGSLILFAFSVGMFGYVDRVLNFLDNGLHLPIGEFAHALGLAPLTLMVMLLSIPSGLASSVGSVSARSVMLARTPPNMRGQVIATQSLFQNVGALIPTLLAGIAADLIGVQRVAIAIGILVAGGAVAALTIYRPEEARPVIRTASH
ncbi:MAG TPA: MFS transporter [Thermomicrobiales bacterium]|nr:MFS transporter [Thermomicrobiales bacterium]